MQNTDFKSEMVRLRSIENFDNLCARLQRIHGKHDLTTEGGVRSHILEWEKEVRDFCWYAMTVNLFIEPISEWQASFLYADLRRQFCLTCCCKHQNGEPGIPERWGLWTLPPEFSGSGSLDDVPVSGACS